MSERARVAGTENAELPAALFRITELAQEIEHIEQFCADVHAVVSELVHAENLFIVIKERASKRFRFVYNVDSKDQVQSLEELNQLPDDAIDGSLTAYAMRAGRTVHLNEAAMRRVCEDEGIRIIGSYSHDWLAVPLLWERNVIGALVVQSYDPDISYDSSDEALLEYVCAHIANLLHRSWTEEALRQANDELESRVADRTAELEHQVAERERGERLQKALFRIAQLANEPLSMTEVYGSIHEVLSELIYARNIFIALADWDSRLLHFPYHADDRETDWSALPVPDDFSQAGPSLQILHSGQPLLWHGHEDEIPVGARGATPLSFLGVPLTSETGVLGVLAVQSYDPEQTYKDRDLHLMLFVARHIANTLERRKAKIQLQEAKDQLERRVEERTEALRSTNDELRNALTKLEAAQTHLIESERLASLGQLVAGVAHEINTPLGVAMTAATHVEHRVQKVIRAMGVGDQAPLDGDDLERLVKQPMNLLVGNLRKAVELISSFKLVAADQFADERRSFDVTAYIGDILTSLRPKIRKAGLELRYVNPGEVEVESYPQALYPVVSNLVMNSIIHGFGDGEVAGTIEILLGADAQQVRIRYRDDGRGMDESVRRRIFDPFFTTRRGLGGTGLGMHIVYNHVHKLGGTIRCHSAPGDGVSFSIELPRRPKS